MSEAPPSVADFAPTERRPLWPLLVAGALLALAAIVATTQSPYRDAYGYSERSWGDWLIRPLERNPELRLPRVVGSLWDISFAADGETGFALGQGGAILATENGGLDWRAMRWSGKPPMQAIAVSAEGNVVVAAGGNTILIARRENWNTVQTSARPLATETEFEAIQVSADGQKIRANASVSGTGIASFAASDDGGATWSKSESPAGVPNALAFDDDGLNGWMASPFGVLSATTDGGKAWIDSSESGSPSESSSNAAFNLPVRVPGATAVNSPLLLGALILAPQPDKSDAIGRPASVQFPNAAVQSSPPAPTDQSRAPAATTPNGAAESSTPPPRVRPPANGKPARAASLRPKQAKSVASSSPVPTVVPSQVPVEAQVKTPGLVDSSALPIVALAAVPGSRTVAGIRWLENSSELFVGRNGYRTFARLYDLAMTGPAKGWAVGGREIWTTIDGATWQKQFTSERGAFNTVAAARDGRRTWSAGDDGMLLASVDGGAYWFPQLRGPRVITDGTYWRFPAPWFYLVLVGLGGFIGYARRPLPVEPQAGVDAMGLTDAPATTLADDKLQFAPLARGISRYLRNANTQPPLTLAISGEWGSGKSSLMRMVCEDLRGHGNHPVWFNAWHHQDEEQLLAALLAAIRDKALPPWLSLDGLRFRAHLFLIRARRKLVATLALVAIASFILAVLTFTDTGDWERWAEAMAGLFPGKENAESAGLGTRLIQGLTGLAGLAGLITTVTGISRALRAFGANPAVLLTSTIDNFKLRDAAAQVHFRTRFQRQFDDVTEALPHPLVIVIDDLDRCRPETVLQVVESVNFLMTSGKCFVLFGMSTPRVQAALALSFKDIAQEFVEIDPREMPATPEQRTQAERRNRLNYAGDYLQKLINLEIRVPAREDIAPHLLLTRSRSPEAAEQFAAARRWFGLLWPLALVAAVAGAAWWEGSQLFAPETRIRPVEQAVPQVPAAQAESPPLAAGPRPGGPAPVATNTPAARPVEVFPGQSGGRDWPMLLLLGGLLAVVAALQYRRRKSDEAVADTDAFSEALRVWTPIVARRSPSPRAIKRFGNRLRYLAMLQQAEDAEPDGGGLLPDWLARRFAANDAGDPPQPSSAKVDVVAEHRIVALGAIHAVFGDRDWREWLTLPRLPAGASPYDDVDKAITAYTACGWRWPPTSQELDAFERSLKGIRLGGEVAVLDSDGKSTDSPGPASSTPPGPQRQAKGPLREEQL